MWRILRPGGILILGTPDQGHRLCEVKGLQTELHRLGGEVLECRGVECER